MSRFRSLRRRLTGAFLYALCTSVYGSVRLLPRSLAFWIGAAGGGLAVHLLRGDARRTAHQIRRLPEHERPTVSQVFRHLGLCVAEVCTLPRGRSALERMVTVEGEDLLRERLAAREGTVWVSGHLGNWELPAVWAASRGVPLVVIAAPVHYPALDRWVRSLRERHGLTVLTPGRRDLRRAVQLLRGGGQVAMLIDQRLPGRGISVPYLGSPAWTTTGAARLARAARVPVVLATSLRTGPGRHLIRFGPQHRVEDADEVDRVTERLSRGLEDVVRSRPEQWVWMHDRWSDSP